VHLSLNARKTMAQTIFVGQTQADRPFIVWMEVRGAFGATAPAMTRRTFLRRETNPMFPES
jgi:hypothetical protein